MTPTQQRILLVLGGIVAVLAIFLVAILAVGAGGNGGSRVQVHTLTPPPSATTAPLTASPTPATTPTPPVLSIRLNSAAPVYTVPDPRGAVVARLPAGLTLPIVGRSDDDRWLLVNFSTQAGAPSTGTGWLAADVGEIAGDLRQAPIAATAPTPTPSPSPSPTQTPSPSPTPTRTPTPAPTPSPAPTRPPVVALPDLVLQDFDVIQSGAGVGSVEIVVRNVGRADLVGQPIEVLGVDQTGAQVMQFATGGVTIPAGGSLVIRSAYRPTARTMLTVVINPNGAIAEADAPPGFADTNNSLTKTVFPLSN